MKNYEKVPSWLLDMPFVLWASSKEGDTGQIRLPLDNFFKENPEESILEFSTDANKESQSCKVFVAWTEKSILFVLPHLSGGELAWLPRNPEKVYKGE